MSWLLFMDESGHDHRSMPYEVRGGFAIHASKLWSFIKSVKDAERNWFGTHLHEVGSEFKGCKLLDKDRIKWAGQSDVMEQSECRKHALNFLNNSKQTGWKSRRRAIPSRRKSRDSKTTNHKGNHDPTQQHRPEPHPRLQLSTDLLA